MGGGLSPALLLSGMSSYVPEFSLGETSPSFSLMVGRLVLSVASSLSQKQHTHTVGKFPGNGLERAGLVGAFLIS